MFFFKESQMLTVQKIEFIVEVINWSYIPKTKQKRTKFYLILHHCLVFDRLQTEGL